MFDGEAAERPLEDLCKATLAGVYADHQRDDIAVLIARLRRLAPTSTSPGSWRPS